MEANIRSTPSPSVGVAIFALPGMSHLTPCAELAKQLVLNHGISVTLITMTEPVQPSQDIDAFLNSLPSGINPVSLPLVDVPSDLHILSQISLRVRYSLPALRTVLHRLKQTTGLAALIADTFCVDSLDVAKEVGVARFLFATSHLYLLSYNLLVLSSPEGPVADLPETVRLPGCLPIYRKDRPEMTVDGQARASLIDCAKRLKEAQGILVNSFYELEPETLTALREKEPGRPPVYNVGPLIITGSSRATKEVVAECLRWLDEQPVGSVLYISFGSFGMLTLEQTKEMAEGLELSGQRFLWVLRCPVDKERAEGVVVDASNPISYLPEGFVERTKGRVFLETSGWAPQVPILSHPSTAGFVTHCGWNSTLESIVNGVAMIAWPMYAEQSMTASLLEEGAKVAIRPKVAEAGVVRKAEIARVAKELMEGEQGGAVRDNVGKLQVAAEKALCEDGSSYLALRELTNKWKDSI